MKSLYNHLLRSAGAASDIAEMLYPVAGLGPVDDAGNVYAVCKEELQRLICFNLDFIRFKNEEQDFLNVLPEDLGLDLKEKVEREYQSFLDAIDIERMVRDSEAEVLGRVEQYAWTNGIKELPEALEMMMDNLSVCAGEYARMICPVDDAALVKAYKAALKTTLAERISGANSDDILIYRQELIDYLEKACTVRFYKMIQRYYSILACSSIFIDVRYKLAAVREYLAEMGVTGEDCAGVPAEYENVPGFVFTDMSETDPEKTLVRYCELKNDNR